MSKQQARNARRCISFLGILIIWQILAFILDNDILIPYPLDVVKTMLTHCMQATFYSIVFHTLMRTLWGFLLALGMALLIAFLSYFYTYIEDFLYPMILLTRSVPNISYIIIVLFWFSSQTSVIIISFLILFPTMYASLLGGLRCFPSQLQDIMHIYPSSKIHESITVYMPYLRPYIICASTAGISLAIKVGIMAEILGQVSIGIGRQLSICRANLDMAGVFAWTIWIILILYIIDLGFTYLDKTSSYK